MKYLFLLILFFVYPYSFSQKDDIVDFGQNLIYENKLEEAISYYEKHLAETTNEEQKIHLFLGLAEIYKLQLNYDVANSYYVQAFTTIKSSNNIQLEFLYHVKMMEFYRKRVLFDKAVEHLDKASLILKVKQINDANMAKFYGRKAALFTEHFFKPDSTLLYAKKALQLSKKVNDKKGVFYATLEISGVYEEKKDYRKAINYLKELIEYAKENNLVQSQVDAYINYTRILIKDNQLNKALEECLNALKFAQENDLFYGEILFIDNIRNIYKKLENIPKAYEYLERRLKLTDKYYNIEHNEFLFELEEKYKLAEKENQIKINKLEIENQNKALASSKTKLYIIIGLFLITIIGILLIAYFLRKSKEDNKRLKALSKENEFLLSEANHRINNNLQLVVILILDQLKKASDTESIQLKNILTKVESISTLHKHLYKSNDINKIDVSNYLNDVKSGFFDIFKEQDIKTNFKVEAVEIPSDYAMYLGLLLTELFINSIKHAFGNQQNKKINFQLAQINDALSFNYSDNGTTTSNQDKKPKLIDKLCRQLKIDYKINTKSGFSFSFVTEISND
ncbi:two-component sensor histidine kinase [Oceanihabitans sediminis]|uniref:histidine kinase n=1 Tax=Oceanihabitans sediminis TaxID=1812012 RepID=A0A368P3S9_9FLAO|nr:sensor histidine kinase [Oceanihabitans sediminis]RBP30752.1 two-component sensor histidine kinase [Oceanihabitans sediminis]RCU56724.1 sensor histidine kinase [Oceanihabitans sediminis]